MSEEIKEGIYVAEQIGDSRLDIHKDPTVDWITVLKAVIKDLEKNNNDLSPQ